MAEQLKSRTKALFEKAFPERQIYHRSGGSIRYVSISPWRQAMIASVATVVVGWSLFATVSVLLRGPSLNLQSGATERKIARMERELKQARASEAIALQLLEKRTREFETHLAEAEERHSTLKFLLANLQGESEDQPFVLAGDSASLMVDSTIEEADARQSHPDSIQVASADGAGFRAKWDTLKEEQASFLNNVEEEAVEKYERSRGVIRLSGVPLNQVMDQPEMGGPLVEADKIQQAELAFGDDQMFKDRVLEVAARLEEARRMESLIHGLPLGAPVAEPYRETSGFGNRIDPFTRRIAWHDGADLAAYYGAPVKATAPGKVTFSGVKAGYGRVVEVDHGRGFRTRYGHLASISVSTGGMVAIGQKVGTMGSTGRSTGPHLHYEVYFRGKSYDPIKFLRAGKHVY
jgi:murein DD-endopeptidase MepM/ murein hydrolase activator NlpD